LARQALAEVRATGRPAIVVGGTGLYLHALLHGMSDLPDVPPDLRRGLRAWASEMPTAEILSRLAALDPGMAALLGPGDRQRLLRALEVRLASGRSLLEWQSTPRRRSDLPSRIVALALVPPAAVVGPRIGTRLAAMLDAGALGEVAALLDRCPDALTLPIAKIHGLRELAAVARGELDLGAATTAIVSQIRRYAKRQRTWFRHQLPELQPCQLVGESDVALDFLLGLIRDQSGPGGLT
jgi:tRNA dimethylallyltransferase